MSFKKILVAVDGGPLTEAIMELASKFAKLEKAKIWVVNVLEVPRALPLEVDILDASIPEEIRHSNEVLDHAADIIENLGLDVVTDQLHAREAGPAIVDEARDLGADLIIIGTSGKNRLGDFLNAGGSTVNYVLKRAPCQVWVIANSQKTAKLPVKGK